MRCSVIFTHRIVNRRYIAKFLIIYPSLIRVKFTSSPFVLAR